MQLLSSLETSFPSATSPSLSFCLIVEFIYFKWGNLLQLHHSNADTLSSNASSELREPKWQYKFMLKYQVEFQVL